MAISGELVRAGFHTSQVAALGGSVATGLSGAGTSSLANATVITAANNVFSTVALNSGANLPAGLGIGDEVYVRNNGANPLLVYPVTAAGVINGGSAGAAFSVTNAKAAIFKCISADGLQFIAFLSA